MAKIAERDDNKCHYCKRDLTKLSRSVDHKHPRSRGGSNRRYNLLACCTTCNQLKADIRYEDFIAAIDRLRCYGIPHYRLTAGEIRRECWFRSITLPLSLQKEREASP